MKEFDIIKNYFLENSYQRKDVQLGIGDDCALTTVPEGQQLVTTTDTLLEGVHFPKCTSGRAVAHKALSVNLSDLAAMGAEPAWISLSLSLPNVDQAWLQEFSGDFERIDRILFCTVDWRRHRSGTYVYHHYGPGVCA